MAASEITVKVEIDEFPQIKRMIETSIPLYRCLCEFDDDYSCCSEHFEQWFDAMEALREAQTGETR